MYSYLADDPPATTTPPPPTPLPEAPATPQRQERFRGRRQWQHPEPQPRLTIEQAGQFAPPGYYQAQPRIVPQPAVMTDAAATESSKTRDWLIQGAIAAGVALLVAMMTGKK